MNDLIKLLIAFLLYGGLAPLLGILLATRRSWQRALFGVLMFMPSLPPGRFTFMLGSISSYRGHVKGFEVSLMEVFSLALVIAVLMGPRDPLMSRRAKLPPGALIYLGWAFAGVLSILNAWEPTYVLMAFTRVVKSSLIFAAAALFLRDEKDLRAAIVGLAVSLILQAGICLKMRYIDGSFQVQGWFEHQNPMAMWAYMSACVVFAVAMHRGTQKWLLWLCLAAFGGAGICVLLSVSRAALAAYTIGAGLVLCMAWIRGPGRRTMLISILGAIGAVMVMIFAMDSLNSRLHEVTLSKEQYTEDLRPVLNRQSKAILNDYPLMGIGWNNFGIANSRPFGFKYSEVLEEWDRERGFTIIDQNYWRNPLTESLYWLILSENGWIGWCFFILFEATTLWYGIRAIRSGGKSLMGYIAFGIFVSLAICYPHGLVERILTQTKNLSHWLLLAGMLSGMELNRRAKEA
ncbi:MAG: hypothetical protein IPK32_09880 [Verrucomicrobiaceae bacterium]|nr:hypothetical protein [Verrucomicrobiaceae bacterium]